MRDARYWPTKFQGLSFPPPTKVFEGRLPQESIRHPLRGELVSLEAGYPTYAQWIPAFTGMTGWGAGPGWPTAIGPPRATSGIGRFTLSKGMPVKALFMRLPAMQIKNGRRVKRRINKKAASGWPWAIFMLRLIHRKLSRQIPQSRSFTLLRMTRCLVDPAPNALIYRLLDELAA